MDKKGAPRPRVGPPRRQFPWRQDQTMLTIRTIVRALGLYLAFLFVSYAFSSAEWRCPVEMDCDRGVDGYFWEYGGPSIGAKGAKGGAKKTTRVRTAGYLLERDVGLGVLASDTCSKLCQDVPDCAYWMYTKAKTAGTCKLWTVEQSPCKPRSWFLIFPFATVRYTRRGKMARRSLAGGPCRQEDEDTAALPPPAAKERQLLDGDVDDIDFSRFATSECPHLECPAPVKGFLFDHKDKGHLRTLPLKITRRRGYNCYLYCRETPGCSVWMIDERDYDGACKMWTKDQSPCEPTDPYDASTAHYIKNIPGRQFMIGGNCHKLPPHPPRKQT